MEHSTILSIELCIILHSGSYWSQCPRKKYLCSQRMPYKTFMGAIKGFLMKTMKLLKIIVESLLLYYSFTRLWIRHICPLPNKQFHGYSDTAFKSWFHMMSSMMYSEAKSLRVYILVNPCIIIFFIIEVLTPSCWYCGTIIMPCFIYTLIGWQWLYRYSCTEVRRYIFHSECGISNCWG